MSKTKIQGTYLEMSLLIVFLLMSSATSGSQNGTADLFFHGTISYGNSLSLLSVRQDTIYNETGPIFLLGCNVRGRAYNPKNDGKYDDWYTDRVADSANLESFGFNTVRLLMYWECLETSTAPNEFSYNDTYLNLLRETIEVYNKKRIYVIIDLHEHGSVNELSKFIPTLGTDVDFGDEFYSDVSNNSAREHLKQLWLRVSNIFKNSSGVAGYDICNEPHRSSGKLSNQQVENLWFDIADYVISSLRANGDNHIVFVNFSPGARDAHFMSRRINDDNVVYSPHFYPGIEEGSLTVLYNDYPQLESDFQYYVNATMTTFNTPFVMEEQGFGSHSIDPGDARDIWLINAITAHRSNPLMQGWLYWCYVAYGGSVEGSGWQTRIVQEFVDKPL